MAGDRAARRLTFQDAGSAVKAAVRLRGDGPIESWVPARVARWLRDELGLREAARTFEAHEISGELLLVLTADDLRDDLGVPEADVERLVAAIRDLLKPPELKPLAARAPLHTRTRWSARQEAAAARIQAVARGWRARRHLVATRTPSRWLVCGGEHERRYFYNELTMVSTYTPPVVLEPYLESEQGLAQLRRAATEPTIDPSPPGRVPEGGRPRWAQEGNSFAGVDTPRAPRAAERIRAAPLPDHVVVAAPDSAVALPAARWRPHAPASLSFLRNARAPPPIDADASVLAQSVLPALSTALGPAVAASHQLGDGGQPTAHAPLAALAATLGARTPRHAPAAAEGELPSDPVGVLYDQLRPALRTALLQPAATAAVAEGGGLPAVARELRGWVGERAAPAPPVRPAARHAAQSPVAGLLPPQPQPQPEPEPEPEPEPVRNPRLDAPVWTTVHASACLCVLRRMRRRRRRRLSATWCAPLPLHPPPSSPVDRYSYRSCPGC